MKEVEINFARLLARCDAQIKEVLDGRERLRFETNLAHLKQLLDQLTSGTDSMSDRVQLGEYARRVEFLETTLRDVNRPIPRPSSLLVSRDRLSAPAATAAAIAATDLETVTNMKVVQQKAAREQLFSAPARPVERSITPPPADLKPRKIMSEYDELMAKEHSGANELEQESPEEILRQHRELQTQLSDSMRNASAVLKQNVTEMAASLRRDDAVIDRAMSVMDGNLHSLQKTNVEVSAFTKSIRSRTWSTWLMVLAVCVVFMLMFFFIRIVPKPRIVHPAL